LFLVVTAGDEASDNNSDSGDADGTMDSLTRAGAIASKFHMVTSKVRLVADTIGRSGIAYSCFLHL